MTTSADTAAEKYPHTTEVQRRIVATFGEHFNNTGGNDPLELLERLATKKNLMAVNMPVAVLAMTISSQVTLLATLERAGVISPTKRQVVMSRHLDVRKHSTWTADVPAEMLDDPRYFDEHGDPTSAFDQWMCDNGTESDLDYGDIENDDLNYEIEDVK